jgi:hypothetical protein
MMITCPVDSVCLFSGPILFEVIRLNVQSDDVYFFHLIELEDMVRASFGITTFRNLGLSALLGLGAIDIKTNA